MDNSITFRTDVIPCLCGLLMGRILHPRFNTKPFCTRAVDFFLKRTCSTDQAELPDPGCKGSFARAPAFGAIVVANDANSHTRINVSLSVSLDNGVSYPHKHVVASGKGGYVDVAMLSDTTAGVLFEDAMCAVVFQAVDLRAVIGPSEHNKNLTPDEEVLQLDALSAIDGRWRLAPAKSDDDDGGGGGGGGDKGQRPSVISDQLLLGKAEPQPAAPNRTRPNHVTMTVDWSTEKVVTHTAATVTTATQALVLASSIHSKASVAENTFK